MSFARGESLRPRSELDALTIKMHEFVYTIYHFKKLTRTIPHCSFEFIHGLIDVINSVEDVVEQVEPIFQFPCVLNADQSSSDLQDCWTDIAHVHALQKL